VRDREQAGKNGSKVNPRPSGPELAEEPTGGERADVRARPGRRSVEERHRAVLDLFAGKATVDQVARRLGVLPETVEGWRQDALGGMQEALRRGTGKTAAEVALERKNRDLEKFVTKLSIQKCLLEQALEIEREGRPTGPARSKR
jgi:transposase-like protein